MLLWNGGAAEKGLNAKKIQEYGDSWWWWGRPGRDSDGISSRFFSSFHHNDKNHCSQFSSRREQPQLALSTRRANAVPKSPFLYILAGLPFQLAH